MVNEDSSRMLSELLFDEKRYEVLQSLLDEPDREFSVVELADETGFSRQFVSNFVQDLSEVGLVERGKKGNMYLISVEEDSAYYAPLRQILSIDSRPLEDAAQSFAEEVYNSYDDIDAVILYGSVARGNPVLNSDIDVLIVKDFESDESVNKLHESINAEAEGFNERLNVDISPHYYDKDKFLNHLKAKRAYVENIAEEGKLLAGEHFWENA